MWASKCRLFAGHDVETMTKGEDHHSDDRIERLGAIVRHGQSTGHYAEPEAADGARHHEAMLDDALAQRNRSEQHRQRQADLMNDRSAEDPAGRRQQAEQDRGREAVHEAEPRQAHRNPVEPATRNRQLQHGAEPYKPSVEKLQHYIARDLRPCPSARRTRIGAHRWTPPSPLAPPLAMPARGPAPSPICCSRSPLWFSPWSWSAESRA